VWLVARLRRAHVIHWVQDIYPELAEELSGQRWLGMLRPIRDLAWRRADGCVTLGRDMAGVLANAGVAADKTLVIPNWGPVGLTPQPANAGAALRTEWNLTGKFTVVYSGNLGRVHDLGPVLALAEALRGETHIAFVFVGSGAQRAAIETEAQRRRLSNVQFRSPQPRTRLAEALALADVHLVTLRPGCERFVFPSKLYGIAAVGRTVIFIGPRDCELARLVVERNLGLAFGSSDMPTLAAALLSLSAEPAVNARHAAAALRFAVDNGGPSRATNQWLGLLDSCGLADLHPS